jgi:flagellar hook-basal body complex protein FliE
MQSRGIDELISQLRAAEALAAGRPVDPAGGRQAAGTGGVDFANALKSALDRVGAAQNHALGLARDFETGDREVALHDVMLAMQKANIAFQATVQVRNRMVSGIRSELIPFFISIPDPL